MARRTFDVIDVVEILQHWHAGRSKAEVAASVGVDRGTVRKYVAPAEAAGLVPGGPPLSRAEWVELVRGWFPELLDAQARSLTYPEINAHRDRIEAMLATNTVTTVHQRLRDEHGLAAGISSFRRYVWLEFGDRPLAGGGDGVAAAGRAGRGSPDRLRVPGFVVRPDRRAGPAGVGVRDGAGLLPAHVRASGAVRWTSGRGWPPCRRVRVLRRGPGAAGAGQPEDRGDQPDLYDPKLNRAYAELAAHYGCLIDPARASKPKDKPRVERPMPYVRDSFWRGREWDRRRGDADRARSRGAPRSPAGAGTGASTAPQPAAVFAAVEADRRCGRCRSSRSSWPRGRRPKVAPGLPRQGRQGALLGAVAADRPHVDARDRRPDRRGVRRRDTGQDVAVGSSGAARPTTATTRPRRSRSSCAPRRGVAVAPASSAPPSPS